MVSVSIKFQDSFADWFLSFEQCFKVLNAILFCNTYSDTAEARSWHSWGKIVTQLRQDRDTAEARSWHSWGKMAFKNLSSIEKETCPNGQVSFIMSCKRDYYSSMAACAAANGNWLSVHYRNLGNIMSMNCTFCTRFPQNIRPFLPLRLLFDILIVKHYC